MKRPQAKTASAHLVRACAVTWTSHKGTFMRDCTAKKPEARWSTLIQPRPLTPTVRTLECGQPVLGNNLKINLEEDRVGRLSMHKEGRKEGRKKGWKGGGREGGRAWRKDVKEGREGRKEERKDEWMEGRKGENVKEWRMDGRMALASRLLGFWLLLRLAFAFWFLCIVLQLCWRHRVPRVTTSSRQDRRTITMFQRKRNPTIEICRKSLKTSMNLFTPKTVVLQPTEWITRSMFCIRCTLSTIFKLRRYMWEQVSFCFASSAPIPFLFYVISKPNHSCFVTDSLHQRPTRVKYFQHWSNISGSGFWLPTPVPKASPRRSKPVNVELSSPYVQLWYICCCFARN